MPDPIPAEAVQAAAAALAEHFNSVSFPSMGGDLRNGLVESWEVEARLTLEAALPHLLPTRRPRIACPVCTREVVKRDDGKPTTHYAKNNDPKFTCKGDMFSRCRGGCKCRKHR